MVIGMFGERLRYARKLTKKTQRQVGAMIGVSPSVLSRWESGLSSPDVLELAQINKALNVSIDWLVLGDPVCDPVRLKLLDLLMRLPRREVNKAVELLECRFSY